MTENGDLSHADTCALCSATPHLARGLCRGCYNRHQKAGTLETFARPPLTPQQLADRREAARVEGEARVKSDGYVHQRVNGKFIPQHRHVMQQALGRPLTKGETVHHINGDRADNRPENLELWFSAQPYGQRVEQLIDYLVTHHAEILRERLMP